MYLYVANATKLDQTVFYRLDFNTEGNAELSDRLRAARHFIIKPGRQAPVPHGDMHESQVKSIISQLETYGAQDIGTVGGGRFPRGKQIPLLLSQGKPVPAKMIEACHDHNQGVLGGQGTHRREQAALATDRMVQDQVDATVKKFEVEIEDIGAGSGSEELLGKDHKSLAVGYIVDKDAQTAQNKNKKK